MDSDPHTVVDVVARRTLAVNGATIEHEDTLFTPVQLNLEGRPAHDVGEDRSSTFVIDLYATAAFLQKSECISA